MHRHALLVSAAAPAAAWHDQQVPPPARLCVPFSTPSGQLQAAVVHLPSAAVHVTGGGGGGGGLGAVSQCTQESPPPYPHSSSVKHQGPTGSASGLAQT